MEEELKSPENKSYPDFFSDPRSLLSSPAYITVLELHERAVQQPCKSVIHKSVCTKQHGGVHVRTIKIPTCHLHNYQ